MSAEHGLYIPEDPNITHFNTGHRTTRLTVHRDFLIVENPMVGAFDISRRQDNGFSYDFLTTPNMFRAGRISQLCKSLEIATHPNTWTMFRGPDHMFTMYYILERKADERKLAPEERIAYHLASDGDDQSHMVFSHAAEPAVQKWGGKENYHELLWPKIAELGGTLDVLRRHGIPFDANIRMPGIEIPSWIDSEHPDVNVDRLQYAIAELLLWFDHDSASPEIRETVRRLCDLDNYEIDDDGNMVFRDVEIARLFAKGYLLLATEHWNDPINRVQLHLLIHALQRSITTRRISWMDEIDKGETRKPENYLMGIDQDFVDALETGPGKADDFIYAIRNSLYPIAMQERLRFITYRMGEYATFLMDQKAGDYPSEYLSPRRVDFGPPSSQVEITVYPHAEKVGPQLKIPTLDFEKDGIHYDVPPLKNRYVDPLVKTISGTKRLSEIDPNYAKLLHEQQELQQMGVSVKLAFAGGFEEAFKEGVKANDREFSEIKERTPMTNDQQRRVIELAAERAKKLNVELGTLVLEAA